MLDGRRFRVSFLALTVLMAGHSALGCPVCDREEGRQVRAGLFGPDFASNLLACAAPFPIFLGIIALIHGVPGSPIAPSREGGGRHE